MKLSSEDVVVIALVVLGIPGALLAQHLQFKPILVAVVLSLGVAAAIYRFLGGIQGASITTGSVRLGGTAAAFLVFTYFVDDKLVQQTTIDPSPGSLLVLDLNTGKPVPVSVDGVTRVQIPKSDAMENHPWSAGLQPRGLLLSTRVERGSDEAAGDEEFSFGHVPVNTLRTLQLFNRLSPKDFLYTEALSAQAKSVSLSPHPFVLDVGSFEGGYCQYRISSNGSPVAQGALLNKAGDIFEFDGNHFLLMVTQADHDPQGTGNEDPRAPWVQFGIVQLELALDTGE